MDSEAAQAKAKLLLLLKSTVINNKTAIHLLVITRRRWLDNLLTFEKISGRHFLSMQEGTRKALVNVNEGKAHGGQGKALQQGLYSSGNDYSLH